MPLQIPAALRREVRLPAVLRREVRLPAALRREVRIPVGVARPVGRVAARGLGALVVSLTLAAARDLRGGAGPDADGAAREMPPSAALAVDAPPVAEGERSAGEDAATDPADAPSVEGAAEGGARFEPRYDEPADPALAEVAERASRSALLEQVARTLNARFVLPAPVAVVAAECGRSNAFYRPADHAITLCYELVRDAETLGARVTTPDSDPATVAAGVAHFVLLHEAGHALIDVLDLPVTGREEDAVDQFATLLLLQDGDGAVDAAFGAAFFRDLGRRQGMTEALSADEHGLSAQRFYNVVCWMYGSDPQTYASFVTRGTLPADRAARCPAEFARFNGGWQRVLAGHTR